MQSSVLPSTAAYDVVGKYDQNRVNGFNQPLLEYLIECVDPAAASHVLDAMAGDGNLTMSLLDYCQRHGIVPPHVTLLEYSRVQSELSKVRLGQSNIRVVWGVALF